MQLTRTPLRGTWCDYTAERRGSRTVVFHRDSGRIVAEGPGHSSETEKSLCRAQLSEEIRSRADVYRFFALVRRMDPKEPRIGQARAWIEGDDGFWRRTLKCQIDAIVSQSNICSGLFKPYLYQLNPEREAKHGRRWLRELHSISLAEAGWPFQRQIVSDEHARAVVARVEDIPVGQVEVVRPGVCRVLTRGRRRHRFHVSHYSNDGEWERLDLPGGVKSFCLRIAYKLPRMYLRDGDFFRAPSHNLVFRAECVGSKTLIGREIVTGRTKHFFAFDEERCRLTGLRGCGRRYGRTLTPLTRAERLELNGRILAGEVAIPDDDQE